MTDKEKLKAELDAMSYEDLLRLWRFGSAGSPYFQGTILMHFKKVIAEKRRQVGEAGHVAASKKVGWKGQIYGTG